MGRTGATQASGVTVAIEAKPFWRSATFWTNVVPGFLLLAEVATKLELPFIQEEWFLALVLMANIVLRFKTKRPMALVKKQKLVKREA